MTIQADVAAAEAHPLEGTTIGLDWGVEHLLTTSGGQHIENRKIGARQQRQVRLAQRALSRCKKGSKRRKKVREKLARLHRKTANIRSNYLHEVSASITRQYAFIAVEKLKVKNMTGSAKGTLEEPGKNVRQKAGLNRAMLDVSPARLMDFMVYKAERAGGLVVKVNPANTSQDCSSCGERVKKTLKERTHRCKCGATLQRDHNAARNILQRALKAHGRAMPPGDPNVGHQPVRGLGTMVAEAA